MTDRTSQQFPYDGPHTADTVIEAAEATAGLVQYLNNATRTRDALRYAATIDAVVGSLKIASEGLDQLLRQLSVALLNQSADDTLYDDRDWASATETVNEAEASIRRAMVANSGLTAILAEVRAETSHLGNSD